MFILKALIKAGGITIVSLILAAFTIGYLAFNHPPLLGSCMHVASQVKAWLTNPLNTGLSEDYNIWLQFLIEERTLVFMFFVIIARLLLALLWSGLEYLLDRGLFGVGGRAS